MVAPNHLKTESPTYYNTSSRETFRKCSVCCVIDIIIKLSLAACLSIFYLARFTTTESIASLQSR